MCQKRCEKGEESGYTGESFVRICVSLAMGPAHISVSLVTCAGVRSKSSSTQGFAFVFQEILAYAKVQYASQRGSGDRLNISIFGIHNLI